MRSAASSSRRPSPRPPAEPSCATGPCNALSSASFWTHEPDFTLLRLGLQRTRRRACRSLGSSVFQPEIHCETAGVSRGDVSARGPAASSPPPPSCWSSSSTLSRPPAHPLSISNTLPTPTGTVSLLRGQSLTLPYVGDSEAFTCTARGFHL